MFDSSYPPSGLEAGSAWRYVSPTRRFYCSSIGVLIRDVRDLHSFSNALKVSLLMLLELSSECILWVELGIGVKHVAFLELSSEWHHSSWARDGRWTRGTLELSSGWRVFSVWVCLLWPVRMSPDGLPSSMTSWRVCRAVKMGYNPRANLAYHGFGL